MNQEMLDFLVINKLWAENSYRNTNIYKNKIIWQKYHRKKSLEDQDQNLPIMYSQKYLEGMCSLHMLQNVHMYKYPYNYEI